MAEQIENGENRPVLAEVVEAVEFAGISPTQSAAILALLEAPTLKAAATEAGVTRQTLYRWLKEPAFKKALREARQFAVRHASACIQGVAGEAVATLLHVMRDVDATAASRVSASRTALELTYHLIEADDVAERLEALEKLRGRG